MTTCLHGRLARQCETCELERVEARIEEMETAMARWRMLLSHPLAEVHAGMVPPDIRAGIVARITEFIGEPVTIPALPLETAFRTIRRLLEHPLCESDSEVLAEVRRACLMLIDTALPLSEESKGEANAA